MGGDGGGVLLLSLSDSANLLMKEAPILIALKLQLKAKPLEASNFKRSPPLTGMNPIVILYSILH